MKTKRIVSSRFARAVLSMAMTAWGSTAALAQVVLPDTQTIVAGDQGSFAITSLNTDTNFLPIIAYLSSEYPDRVVVDTAPIQQELTPDNSNYVSDIWFSAVAIKPLDGEVTPVPIDITLTRHGSVFTSLVCSVTVDDPTFTFNPPSPSIRVGDTAPLVIRRVPMNANASLELSLMSGNGSVLALGKDRNGLKTDMISVTFGRYEWNKTVYMSSLSMVQGVTSTNIPVTARVGSYATNSIVLVTTNSELTLSPANPTTAAGDALPMTITRMSTTNVSPIEVHLTADDPLTLFTPSSVTIPSGQRSANFFVVGRVPGGATIHATAIGVQDTTNSYSSVTVSDPTLSYSQNLVTTTVGGARVITINRPYNEAGGDLQISLVSLAPFFFRVEASRVIIPAGYVSATTTVFGLSTGTGFLQAGVGSYSVNLPVTVLPTALDLAGPVAVRVGQTNLMTITRGGDLPSSALTINLSGSDSGEFLDVPASVTIQAGQTSAVFNVIGIAPGTNVEVRASAAGYPSDSVLVPVIPTNPLLRSIVWRDVDGSKTYSAGDTVTLTFNSSMATSTVTTTNLTLKELSVMNAWTNSPGSWGTNSTIAAVDPGTCTRFCITLAGLPALGAGIAVDPSAAVTDVLGYPDTTVPPVYLPSVETDSNTNGIPDWWEELYFGGATNVSATADSDGDGLINLWEFNLGAKPLDAYSLDPSDLVKDGDWDSDRDGLINRLEIDEYGTDPRQADTDDDDRTDDQELDTSLTKNDEWRGRRITSPIYSRSPLIQRSMLMTGIPIMVPDEAYLDRAEWMVDLWVRLTNSTSTGNLVCRKTNAGLTNFCLRVDNNVPTIEFQSPGGVRYAISGVAIPANLWTHLTASWIPTCKSLELKQNEVTYQAQILASACARGRGSVALADIGSGGYLDKVMVRNPLPVDVVFVLDISGSMSGDRLVALKQAATLAIDVLPQDTPIGLVAFSDDATNLTHGFSTDKIKLKRVINSLVVKNLTDYTRAINCATSLVSASSTLDRHLMIFISDGEPNPPESAPSDDLLIQSANMGIVINTIGFQLYDPSQLQRMSNLTDGKYFDAPTAQDLQTAFAVILKELYKTRYLFDDGGMTAEDFERPLNWSNALSGVNFATNTYVETTDLELGDTEPSQWWQKLFFGPNGCDPMGDADKDGLINLYEYYCDTNPRDDDTDHDGVLDGAEDYDSDGLQNMDEQTHAADPRLTDTDDDGVSDLAEKLSGTDPSYSLSPYFPRIARFGGTTNDFLTMPLDSRFKLMSWTLEAWVNPASNWVGNGSVIHRDSEAGETNFFLALDGNLRPVAGFGRHSVSGTAAIANNFVTWTHLAATYDSASQELKLFVNATQVADRVCSENPRASGIGPVVQRIGQAFNGLLDEVRIWNVSRNPESLVSARDRSLSGSEPGLVAYYRFDDNTRWAASPTVVGASGNNITNGVSAVDPGIHPWSWGQVEDFATAYVKKDWTNRWKNAATINGSVNYSNAPGVTAQYPAVRVMLRPAPVVGEGARWSLNGSDWRESGDVAAPTGTNSLSATIGYRSIYGWTEPSPETVQLTNGMTRTLVRYYQLNGTLSICVEPMEARSNGAMWRMDGGEWRSSETIVSNVAPGAHLIDFKTIDGWQEPPLETVQLAEGQAMGMAKFYSPARGALIVNIDPAGARAAGAQWSVDEGGWQNSGSTNILSPGNHNVSFRNLSDWTTPGSQQVALVKGQTSVVNVTYQYGIRSVSGTIFDESLWNNRPPRSNPPGDGSGSGRIRVGAWLTSTEAYGSPLYQNLLATNVLPAFGSNYVYSIDYLEPQPTYLGYQVRAWVDADNNGRYDIGEPASAVRSFSFVGDNVGGINLTIVDDLDNDSLPDWWEAHWFGNIGQIGSDDFDRDGLSNLQEYNLAEGASGLVSLNPADWDSDGDGMDDNWEVEHFAAGVGLNPTTNDAFGDVDGDGLSNIQEYNGVDGLPRIEQDLGLAWGIASTNMISADDLNPLNVDTDGDSLVDSFEAAWCDAASGIDPKNSVAPTGMLQVVIVKANGTTVTNTTTLSGADPDQDGLTIYREQCLLAQFREGGANDIWSTGASALPVMNTNNIRAFSPPLLLGATHSPMIAGDLAVLRAREWTNPGNPDTDGDLLPDGWEVEYGLDPKSVLGADGFWGDPDEDRLLNSQEYIGQDGDRSSNRPYVNGSGDETNPKEHNWRPHSTGPGPGVMRPAIASDYWYSNTDSPTNGTLGAALPTASLGADDGLDTDDDGIPDNVEIQMEYLNLGVEPSPVHSMSPFIKRAAMIRNNSGIVIPDPEGSAFNYNPTLHKRDWTVECYMKLLATNMTGYLVNNPGPFGIGDISYRLSLTNNTPIIAFNTLGGIYYKVVGPALPTGRWIHLAGSWDHANNSLSLYVDGVFAQATRIEEEALSGRLYGSATPPVIGCSADGTFSNRLLMDEIRIWGVARTGDQIEQYRTKLAPQNSAGLLAYYRFDDGGTAAEDFARKAKNGLFGSAAEDYLYGDFGYALRTNNFSFVTNDYAVVLGVDARGADDTDGDGMPDDWETVNHLDPLSTNGMSGAWDDADDDGLANIYESWSDTNPHDWDTDQNGIFDVNEDRDGDGVVNLTEQQLGSRPDMVDTDDDGLTDNEERGLGTNPADATDPVVSRSVEFDGAPSDYLEIPILIRQRMVDWTLEAWVNPANTTGGVGTIVRRVVQNLGGGSNAMNFVLGVETNASGALQAYAGYVLDNGSRHMIHGGELPTGTWTHAAAVYNSANASLSLYTNGYLAVSSNGLYSAPPINGKGGETFLRIGEDFNGRIDEVRLWNMARPAGPIRTNFNKTVSESQTNLVDYFRFDDGQAVTNRFPFGPYHQPHGAQDFVYGKDWMEQWKHEAMFRGNVRFVEPGGVQPPAFLRINLLPPGAVTVGAQWSLDGGSYNNSGDTLGDLATGMHTLLYKSISGWTAPSNEVITLTNGVATTLRRIYLQNGGLTVNLEPLGAVAAGAQWRLDGGAWQDGGVTVSNLSPAAHSVEFKSVEGWAEPPTEVLMIGEGDRITITQAYRESLAFLQVNLLPVDAIMAGAQWNLNGGGWQNSGTNIALSAGTVNIGYRAASAWIAPSNETINLIADTTTSLMRVYLQNTTTDTDKDGMLDAWEIRWFGALAYGAEDDPDRDGLKNIDEFQAAQIYTNLDMLSPANFDSDGDTMDDQWEYYYYLEGAGLNPVVNDAMLDRDGDGLINVQEYNGIDSWPRLMQDPMSEAGVAASNVVSADCLNPIHYDTDGDKMVDSFEAAWYDPARGVDPLTTGMLFSADSDDDGMSGYREQCLLVEFREGESNDIWSHGTNDLPGMDTHGVFAFNPPLQLGATNSVTILGDLAALRRQEWTDPLNSDTDDDTLPDGWEVEFNLDPNNASSKNGFWGDPDGDGLLNSQEYLGQDGNRSTNHPYVNGSGDETNPNEHNWRPASTGPGPGIQRPSVARDYWYQNDASPTNGTLGAALPTASLGVDKGFDTDDDGIPDIVEIQQEYRNLGMESSPVHSMSPFIKRSALIKTSGGIEIPDPEGSSTNYSPLLHRRDWTIECYVKLLGTNLTGYLVNNPGPFDKDDISYRLSLSNNAPVVAFHTLNKFYYQVSGPILPTNKWIYLAGVWDHANNNLSLYIDGVYFQSQRVTEEAISSRLYGSATSLAIGASANGSFTNRLLMDEIRIWGVARTAEEIEQYRRKLAPQNSAGLLAYYRFDDGGATAEDFARKAKNGLLGVDSADYSFGDFGYALRTNGFAFVTNDYAMVSGSDFRGADDTDGDGLPDDWEVLNHLNPFSATGDDGAQGDPDYDSLVNIHEYWSDTNPHSPDTDQDGVSDINEDRDGDGVANFMEQRLGSRPDMMDTDDDGLIDNIELVGGTSPADAADPQIGRAMLFGGAAGDFLDIPTLFGQRLTDWSLEAWVNPAGLTEGVGTVIRRVVQNLGPGSNVVNYVLGLETNLFGKLQIYAGYVDISGREFFVRGGAVPIGAWTHVAVTYNWLNSTLTAYTNGVLAAVSTNYYNAPPLNGKGGETFVRIGEDFGGIIDEVRVWSDTRTRDEILNNLYSYLDASSQGLIQYFNFDDSQANTNTFPFGLFHQPFGAQDLVYPKDWTNQWIHAAILRGNVRFATNSAVMPAPSIQVILQPQAAVDAGAKWSLDGGAVWHNSGETVQNLDRVNLNLKLIYKSVAGWSAPPMETVIVSNGQKCVLSRYYIGNESTGLHMELQPPQAVSAGAGWRIYGETNYLPSGSTVDTDAGTYIVEFRPLTGWLAPGNLTVAVQTGETAYVTATYLRYEVLFTNLLNFLNNPRGLALDSRRRLYIADSGNNRIVIYDTQSGSVTNWGGPTNGAALGQFYQPQAIAIDADDNVYIADTHNYRIQRRNALTNNCVQWTGVTPWDIALDWRTNLYVAEYYNHRVQKLNPATGIWTTFVSNGILDGLVRSPGGVAIDASNNIVVADYPNNQGRIQRFGTNGVVMGRFGSYLGVEGSLSKPQSLAFGGSSGALFVSDVGSNTVLRRNGDATWQTVIGAGVVPGAGGLAWDAQGYLYVSDTAGNRVLKISALDLADIPPSLSNFTRGTNGMAMTWWGAVGWLYTLQYTDSLLIPWTNVAGSVEMKGVYRVMNCIDTNNFGIPSRLYRMRYH